MAAGAERPPGSEVSTRDRTQQLQASLRIRIIGRALTASLRVIGLVLSRAICGLWFTLCLSLIVTSEAVAQGGRSQTAEEACQYWLTGPYGNTPSFQRGYNDCVAQLRPLYERLQATEEQMRSLRESPRSAPSTPSPRTPSTGLSVPSATVVYSDFGCDYFVVRSSEGSYSVLESWDGWPPDRGDVLIGEVDTFGFEDLYNLTQRSGLKVWIDDFLLDEREAVRTMRRNC